MDLKSGVSLLRCLNAARFLGEIVCERSPLSSLCSRWVQPQINDYPNQPRYQDLNTRRCSGGIL